MSITALMIVVLGLSIALSRAPLIVAPVKVRDAYLKLFDTPGKMRIMGFVMGAVAAAIAWAVWDVGEAASEIVKWVALYVLVLAALVMLPFPAFASRLATSVWMAFPPTALRFMGALAVAIGGLIIWYGPSL